MKSVFDMAESFRNVVFLRDLAFSTYAKFSEHFLHSDKHTLCVYQVVKDVNSPENLVYVL